MRRRLFDAQVSAFLSRHPRATVVNLGEGIDTQFWRLDNGQAHWLTVDFPQVLNWRHTVLPGSCERQQTVACSATSIQWTRSVPPQENVLISAQGLVPYLRRNEVTELIAMCAERFPHAVMYFDAYPRWVTFLARRRLLRTGRYKLPPMFFSARRDLCASLLALHPHLTRAGVLPWSEGAGLTGMLFRHAHRARLLPHLLPAIVCLEIKRSEPDGSPTSEPMPR
ncbi:class I SAM-dependent methyltransferase [Streptomyces sp. ISL-11]|nr:class I SAM-dependent methyltransferase [Streptomyces sp. ISL-11]